MTDMERPKTTDLRTKKLINKLAKLQAQGTGKSTTDWEKKFLKEVKERVSTYGSAFVDQEKGSLDQSLSYLQSFKMREINRMIHYRQKKKSRT